MEYKDVSQNQHERFGSNEVSRETLQNFAKLTKEIAKDNPWFVGNTITGSMVVGTAHRRNVEMDQDHSDIDAHWFYDSSKMDMQVIADTVPPGELKYNPDEKDQKHLAAMYKIKSEVKRLYQEHFDQEKADIEETFKDLYQSPDPMALVHDVNTDVLKDTIHTYGDPTEFEPSAMSRPDFSVMKFIFLAKLNEVGVSEGVDQLDHYRQFILDELQKTRHGEEILQRLMDDVGKMERPQSFGRLPFAHYPPTIDDARQFFHLTEQKESL
jgi:hypothetical protein